MLRYRKVKRKTTVLEKKLADRLREAIRLRGYSIRTEKAYVSWYEKYVRFHKLRHPETMGPAEITASRSVTHLAVEKNVAASTQNPCTDISLRWTMAGLYSSNRYVASA